MPTTFTEIVDSIDTIHILLFLGFLFVRRMWRNNWREARLFRGMRNYGVFAYPYYKLRYRLGDDSVCGFSHIWTK